MCFCRDYLWLYKVSYLYNGVAGLLITFVVGYAASYVFRKIAGEAIRPMDPNLFVPPLSKRFKKRWDDAHNMKTLSET